MWIVFDKLKKEECARFYTKKAAKVYYRPDKRFSLHRVDLIKYQDWLMWQLLTIPLKEEKHIETI